MFSFSLQMEDGRVVPLLQYVVSLAVTEAIQSACQTKGYPLLDVKLKWPNDIYFQGLKVGGVLCTSTYRSKMFNVTVGIGLNLDNDQPTTCLNQELKKLNSEAVLGREELMALFFNKLESLFEVFMANGFQALEALYYKTWLHGGQRIHVEEMGDGGFKENVAVTIEGLTSSGYLLAIGDDDQYYELHPDGNSFDFLKGLVRKKVEGQ